MKHSLYIRNFIATALIVLISFSILGGLSTIWNYRRAFVERRAAMTSALQETARYVSAQHFFDGMELSDLDLSMWLAVLARMSGFDLLVADATGVVVACSNRDFENFLGKSVPEADLKHAANDNGTAMLSSIGSIYPHNRLVAGTPLTGEKFISGFLFISIDPASYRETWKQFTSAFILIALNVMAVAFVISYFMTKKQAEPLNEIAGAVSRFAHGDLSARVDDAGRQDEISHLSQAFNTMADSLESSEKLRRDFIANLSHELRTPMTVIAGFAEGILDGTISPEDAPRFLNTISSETRRLSRLVESMLDMSKLQSANDSAVLRNSFDLPEVVRLSILSLEGKIDEKSLGIVAELPEESVMTLGDRDSITQVVYNLIDNAIKFSFPNGTIRIEVWKQGDRAYVAVENSGETIPASEMPLIFDRFHKTDKSRSIDREGVGLGLYIVKTILDNHNEDIFVTSSDGVTKFVFTLSMA